MNKDVSDRQSLDEIKMHVTHLLYAIDRGYFGDVTGLRDSAFVTPLRTYVNSGFLPVERVMA